MVCKTCKRATYINSKLPRNIFFFTVYYTTFCVNKRFDFRYISVFFQTTDKELSLLYPLLRFKISKSVLVAMCYRRLGNNEVSFSLH